MVSYHAGLRQGPQARVLENARALIKSLHIDISDLIRGAQVLYTYQVLGKTAPGRPCPHAGKGTRARLYPNLHGDCRPSAEMGWTAK